MSKGQLLIIQPPKLELERLYYPIAVAFGRDWNPEMHLYFSQFKMEFKWAEIYFKDSLITAKNKTKNNPNGFGKFRVIFYGSGKNLEVGRWDLARLHNKNTADLTDSPWLFLSSHLAREAGVCPVAPGRQKHFIAWGLQSGKWQTGNLFLVSALCERGSDPEVRPSTDVSVAFIWSYEHVGEGKIHPLVLAQAGSSSQHPKMKQAHISDCF